MNGPLHFNSKWWVISALFFGFLFFLMGFGGFIMERQSLLSNTIRYLEKASNYTALRERVKGLNTKEAVPVWSGRSGIDLVFCYPISLGRTIEPLKTLWPQKFHNFSKIFFSPFPNGENWTISHVRARLNRYINEDLRSFFLGYFPVFSRIRAPAYANEKTIIKYHLYIRIPALFVNSFPEELIYTSLGEKPFLVRREPTDNGTVFELTWDEIFNSKHLNPLMDLPDPVTEILTRIDLLMNNRTSLH